MTKEEMLEIYLKATEPVAFVKVVNGSITCAWANFHDEATVVLPETDAALVAFRDRKNPEPTTEQKLKAAGFSVEELKRLFELDKN